ncbi:MAG: ATP-dependent DNA helicase RecG, partial [Lachnospiraceae bacterium]|nr:ATP-dependent DNA helicase RecG [Lachnospiraceae bacterium]
TFGKLLYFFPRTYLIYPAPIEDADADRPHKAAVLTRVPGGVSVKKTRSMDIAIARTTLQTASLEIVWFRMPYIRSKVLPGKHYVFYGNLFREKSGTYKMEQPAVFSPEEYDALRKKPQPVYHLTKGLSNNAVIKAVKTLFADGGKIAEYLPAWILKSRELMDYSRSLYQMHFPDDFDTLTKARRRLVYNEFFDFFVRMQMDAGDKIVIDNPWTFAESEWYEKVKLSLPFALTAGQEETLDTIRKDLSGAYVSQRLVQGDVGSGKTILAFLLMVCAAENGYQSAIMAPTEVLARQHYETFCGYIDKYGLPFETVLVTGSVKGAARRKLNERIATEKLLLIIGTHALFTENMEYNELALVITDEQHRFGVKQRKMLSDKGGTPHVIVMSATPIPRTLAMILYGDMDISVIRDVPAKRLPIKNSVVKKNKQRAAWKFIKDEVEKGHQAYIICPLVEASEKTESENVTEYGKALREYYGGGIAVDILHGRMTAEEKDRIMTRFAANESQVLVSTTVIEVGINVPNATVMVIEDANRFGLAQLHQLRGRVGRGEWQSYCIFIDGSDGEKLSERLVVVRDSNDGFHIASEDLKLRGPGDFYGIRQSGDLNFALADIYQDADVMGQANEDVKTLLNEDLHLQKEENRALAEHLLMSRELIYTNL